MLVVGCVLTGHNTVRSFAMACAVLLLLDNFLKKSDFCLTTFELGNQNTTDVGGVVS